MVCSHYLLIISTHSSKAHAPLLGLQDAESWRPLHSSSEPHKVVLPCHYNQLDSFKKLLVVRCVRPDKVVPAVADFVLQHLGRSFVEPPPFSLTDCYRDSSCLTPLIFVLSPGSDPTAALLQFAGELHGMVRWMFVDIGIHACEAAALSPAMSSLYECIQMRPNGTCPYVIGSRHY